MSERSSRKGPLGLYVFGAAAVVAAVLGVLGLSSQRARAEADEGRVRREQLAAGLRVRVAQVAVSPSERVVTLPGEVRARVQATLYAKVSGYLKEIRVDKGVPWKDLPR